MLQYSSLFGCFLAIGFMLSSCGQSEKVVEASGGEIGEGSFGLIGSWEGILLAKSKTGKLEDTSLVEIQENPVRVIFEGGTEEAGQFRMTIVNIDNAVVRGSYRNFAGKSLILTINESNVSSLGLTGGNTDVPYELTGNHLLLKNDRFTLKLTRVSSKAQGSSDNKKADSTRSIASRWKCIDSLNKVWLVHLREDKSFTIDITTEGKSSHFMWLDGKTEDGDGSPFLLIVERSSQPKYVGLRIVGEIIGEALILRRSASEDQAAFEKVTCARR